MKKEMLYERWFQQEERAEKGAPANERSIQLVHFHPAHRGVTGAGKAHRGVTGAGKGGQFPGRGITMGAPNDCEGRRKVPTKSQVLSSTLASERSQVQTWGHQTCFLPRVPSNLVAPLPAK